LDRTSVQEHSRVLTPDGIDRSLRRISHEILERNASNLDGFALVGVLTRGVPLARRISENIRLFEGIEVPVGALDITLHRDDLVDGEAQVKGSLVPFEVRADYVGKNVPTSREERVLVNLRETDGEDGVIVVGD
jgi:pyrimidine operon attenuation protein/uracil phosphoribosyltransferase